MWFMKKYLAQLYPECQKFLCIVEIHNFISDNFLNN